GKNRISDGPGNSDVGIVPRNPSFRVWSIVAGLFVLHLTDIRKSGETMSKSDRHQKLGLVFCTQFDRERFAKRCGTYTEIDRHIQDPSRRAAHELRYRCPHVLIVKSAQDAIR